MTATIMPLLMALVALIVLDIASVQSGSDAHGPADDGNEG